MVDLLDRLDCYHPHDSNRLCYVYFASRGGCEGSSVADGSLLELHKCTMVAFTAGVHRRDGMVV